jgi:Rrf2 family iron-sulfur cluster assembly transcriptional regulator
VLLHVLGALVRSGILTAVAGRDGGYALERSPMDLTLLELIEAADGPLVYDRCLLTAAPCNPDNGCLVHATWASAQRTLLEELGDTTLADILSNGHA